MVSWIYSGLLIAPQLFTKNRFVLEGLLTSCTFDYLNVDNFTRTMILTMFVLGFFLPLFIIILFYLGMYIKLRNNSLFLGYHVRYKTSQTDTHEDEQTNETKNGCEFDAAHVAMLNGDKSKTGVLHSTQNSLATIDKMDGIIMRREIKLVKMILIMVFMFCLSWMPYSFISLYAQYGANLTRIVTPVTTSVSVMLAKSSSLYNPIIYTLSNKDCMKFFHKLLHRKTYTKETLKKACK